MKYIDIENERNCYVVRECLNGFAIQVQDTATENCIPLTPSWAGKLGVTLPDVYRQQACCRLNAEKELERLAKLNGWTKVE